MSEPTKPEARLCRRCNFSPAPGSSLNWCSLCGCHDPLGNPTAAAVPAEPQEPLTPKKLDELLYAYNNGFKRGQQRIATLEADLARRDQQWTATATTQVRRIDVLEAELAHVREERDLYMENIGVARSVALAQARRDAFEEAAKIAEDEPLKTGIYTARLIRARHEAGGRE